MINQLLFRTVLVAIFLICPSPKAGELLGHISDDTEPSTTAKPEPSQNNDRRIIYRVICSPEDEALPDCEHPVADQETSTKPTEQTTQEKILDAEEQVENPSESTQPQASDQTNRKKSHGETKANKSKSTKKTGTNKKSDNKKSAAKKSTPKKKKR